MNNQKLSVYISSSWKNRKDVRRLAIELRKIDFSVYDFTDPKCRTEEEMPPEKFPEQFNPEKHSYWNYLNKNEGWRNAVKGNKCAIDNCDLIILLLPCGIDATADWAYGVGKGKKTFIIGHPPKGERSPSHLWADGWFPNTNSFLETINSLKQGLEIFL